MLNSCCRLVDRYQELRAPDKEILIMRLTVLISWVGLARQRERSA